MSNSALSRGTPPRRRRALVAACLVALVSHPAFADPAGPLKRIAVAKFETTGKFSQAQGMADAGTLLADQFSTILAESGKFDVVDRADVSMTLKEQGLVPKSAAMGTASDDPAQLLGAQIIVRTSITTFDQKSGGGLSLGLGSGDMLGSLGRKSEKDVIGIDIRLVDTTTGRIIGTAHVDGVAKNVSFSLTAQRGTESLGKDSFQNTPLGEATAAAFRKAVPLIEVKLRDVTWNGRIAEVADGQAFLNMGAIGGVKLGDVFSVSHPVRRIVDPASGEVLGVTSVTLGDVTVVDVQDRFSRVEPGVPMAIQRGDVARFLHAAAHP